MAGRPLRGLGDPVGGLGGRVGGVEDAAAGFTRLCSGLCACWGEHLTKNEVNRNPLKYKIGNKLPNG